MTSSYYKLNLILFHYFYMTKSENIKNYYIKKHIEKQKLQAKLNARNLRISRNGSLEFKLWENLISRINKAYKNTNVTRTIPYKTLIGCNENELYIHLENLLPKDLKMQDYTIWEIDHIKPIILFDLNIEHHQLECFNYKNTRPLLMSINRRKLEL